MTAIIDALERAGEGAREPCTFGAGALDRLGRKRVWVGGKLKLLHRVKWEEKYGPIPAGVMLCHHCDNSGCLTLSHMYAGTHADNMRDMKNRRRYFAATQPERARKILRENGSRNDWSRGRKNPKAKLTIEQVAAIASSAEPTKRLAGQYGVNRTTIQRIRSGDLWKS